MSFLGRLPVDVLILCPNLNTKCYLTDPLLYEVNYTESLSITHFPEESSEVRIGTAAYHAERDLDTFMYQDTGIYRNKQYGKANVINLQTMYEEIRILWDQELKYRPNFSTVDGVVNIPGHFFKDIRSQRRTCHTVLGIRKRTDHGRYGRSKRCSLYFIDSTKSNEVLFSRVL